jgi:uncharacterized phage protein (TIGR02218 family)
MPTFQDVLNEDVTRLVLCWRLVRRDGVVLGFTAHDRDIILKGQRYRSAPSFVPSALVRSASAAVDSLDMQGALSHAAITEHDLLAGRYDQAQLFMFMLDWQQPGLGQIDLGSGHLGNISSDGAAFRAEVRGITDMLERSIIELASPECRADLADKRCRANLRPLSRIAAIALIVDAQSFEADGLSSYDEAYANGRLRWITGANSGQDAEVMTSLMLSEVSFNQARVRLTLRDVPFYPMTVSDRFEVSFGCDKRYVTCYGRFANQHNFRGEPFVPGVDALIRYPDAG